MARVLLTVSLTVREPAASFTPAAAAAAAAFHVRLLVRAKVRQVPGSRSAIGGSRLRCVVKISRGDHALQSLGHPDVLEGACVKFS
jgi:hypothetical protein